MAVVSDSRPTGQGAGDDVGGGAFDMVSLKTHLPLKRKGLSMYFSGKSRSFTCIADATCVNDLKKDNEIPEAKRKKYSDRQVLFLQSPVSCRAAPGNSPCSPCIGV